MNEQDKELFDRLDNRIRELELDKEQPEICYEITHLSLTIANSLWWDKLAGYQLEDVRRHMKAANEILMSRFGIYMQLIETKYDK